MAVTSLTALIVRIIEFFGGLLERRRQAELASIELAGRFDAVAGSSISNEFGVVFSSGDFSRCAWATSKWWWSRHARFCNRLGSPSSGGPLQKTNGNREG